jgi:hypothetical protein
MMTFFIAFYESYLSTACILSLGHQGGEHGRLLGPREGHHHHLLRELQASTLASASSPTPGGSTLPSPGQSTLSSSSATPKVITYGPDHGFAFTLQFLPATRFFFLFVEFLFSVLIKI